MRRWSRRPTAAYACNRCYSPGRHGPAFRTRERVSCPRCSSPATISELPATSTGPTMFTPERREEVRQRLLDLARAGEDVVAAALIGSHAAGTEDEWSDVDLTLGIRGDLGKAIERWTSRLYGDFRAIHHWDLPWGPTTYRVFLLPELLQVDISFTPEPDFGPRGPNWQTVFGETVEPQTAEPPSVGALAGLAWTMCLHARRSIERWKPWQAENMISGVRDHVLE